MKPYYHDDKYGITIYHGDCRDILPKLEPVDLVLTDPPYGVMLGEANTGQERNKGQATYSCFSDTTEYLRTVVIPSFERARSMAARAVITPGNRNAFLYPPPDDVGVWFNPAGTGCGKWGFCLAHLVFFYGVDPKSGRHITASSVWKLCAEHHKEVKKQIEHPCPKPLSFVKWQINKASLAGETVLDPFMGSGTTLVAAKQLGRKAIGIEIEEKYCEIAVRRLQQDCFQWGKLDD